jgi:hypothetical protein
MTMLILSALTVQSRLNALGTSGAGAFRSSSSEIPLPGISTITIRNEYTWEYSAGHRKRCCKGCEFYTVAFSNLPMHTRASSNHMPDYRREKTPYRLALTVKRMADKSITTRPLVSRPKRMYSAGSLAFACYLPCLLLHFKNWK